MEYIKHKYSKRVYQIMTDHGPDHPYLSCFPFIRDVTSRTMNTFFYPCSGPMQNSPISVPQEIDWEKRQLRRKEPLVVQAPEPVKRRKRISTGYTLRDLCSELNISPPTARKLLRAKGKIPPEGGWKWPNKEEAKPIKKFLKKFL